MKNNYNNLYKLHFGKIMSNYSIVGLSFIILILLGSLISALYMVFAAFLAIIIIIASGGLIFIVNPTFLPGLFSGGEIFLNIMANCIKAVPYVIVVNIVSSILGLIFICFSKQPKTKGRIIFTSIILAISIIIGIVLLAGGLPKWKH